MSGLICGVCGTPWKLDKPLLYHLGALHCDSHACSRTCDECKDWEEAITHGETRKTVSFTKAPGYAAMMAKLKGGV